MKIHYLSSSAIAISLVSTGVCFGQDHSTSKPNVLFILVDDMGACDLACTGSDFYETPNIDKLALDGVLFTNGYAACPVSSPSRGAIMTGKYPARTDLTDYIPGNQAYGPHKDQLLESQPFCTHIQESEKSLGQAFKDNGYKTFFAGKWHLGEESKYYPTNFGFEINKGGNSSGHPAGGRYFSPYKNPQLADGVDGEYLTDRLTDETITFIKNNRDNQFFAYLSFYTVHSPLIAKEEKIAKYKEKLRVNPDMQDPQYLKIGAEYHKQSQNHVNYAAMIESLDDNVGRLMSSLDELGLKDNTIIVFTSDNGGVSVQSKAVMPTSNLPYRAGKGWLYEGGIKVPAIISWASNIPANRECSVPLVGTDYYPTLLDLCGLKLQEQQHLDGISLKSAIYGGHISRDAIYWHYPHYSGGLGGRPASAIRSGRYKLIEFFEDGHVELYDLSNDPSEQYNLAGAETELASKLLKQLRKWRKNIDAKVPIPNRYYVGV